LRLLGFIIAGLIGGSILASTGIIGPILIPALLLMGLPSGVARGTTFVSELLMTLSCVLGHRKERNVDRLVTLALLPGVVTGVLGATVSVQLPELHMKLAVGILEMIIGATVVFRASKMQGREGPEATVRTKADVPKFVIAAILGGTAKGFFGMGWGPIVVGSLVLLGVKSRIAVGSSLVGRLLLDSLAGITYLSMNLVDFEATIALAVAGALIALPTVRWTKGRKEETLRTFVGGMITIVGAIVIAKELLSLY